MSGEELNGVTVDAPESGEGKIRVRWGFIFVWIFVLAFLIIISIGIVRSQMGPVGVGSKAPLFTLTTFDGEEINVEDHLGEVMVVNFWASWCLTCEDEAAELEQAYRKYKDQGVLFLGVDYVDTETAALAYLEEFGITYPNGPDLGTKISQAYRMRAVPETYIIGKDGRLAAVKIGPYMSLGEIETAIDAALAE